MITLGLILVILVLVVALVGIGYEMLTGSLTGIWLACSGAWSSVVQLLGEAVSELFKD